MAWLREAKKYYIFVLLEFAIMSLFTYDYLAVFFLSTAVINKKSMCIEIFFLICQLAHKILQINIRYSSVLEN